MISKRKAQQEKENYIASADTAKKEYLERKECQEGFSSGFYGRKKSEDVSLREHQDVVDVGVESDDERIDVIDQVIKRLEQSLTPYNSSEVAAIREYILGLKALRIEYAESKRRHAARIKAGLKMNKDYSGNISKSEERTIKTTRKEISYAAKQASKKLRELGREKDSKGRRVKKIIDEAKRTASGMLTTATRNTPNYHRTSPTGSRYTQEQTDREKAIVDNFMKEVAKKHPLFKDCGSESGY